MLQGLPYVVNMTLPDRSEDYIHRIGRVGRADTMGLAISLVSAVPERVWYCSQKGYKPWLDPQAADVRDHTIWYNEQDLLKVSCGRGACLWKCVCGVGGWQTAWFRVFFSEGLVLLSCVPGALSTVSGGLTGRRRLRRG